MSKSYKLKGDNYIDSSGIVHDSNVLNTLLESMLNKEQGIVDRIAGYGQPVQLIDNTSGNKSWNDACGSKTGFYRGSTLSNAPSGNTISSWWFVIHIVHDHQYKCQIAVPFGYVGLYIRSQNAGNWTNWTKVI